MTGLPSGQATEDDVPQRTKGPRRRYESSFSHSIIKFIEEQLGFSRGNVMLAGWLIVAIISFPIAGLMAITDPFGQLAVMGLLVILYFVLVVAMFMFTFLMMMTTILVNQRQSLKALVADSSESPKFGIDFRKVLENIILVILLWFGYYTVSALVSLALAGDDGSLMMLLPLQSMIPAILLLGLWAGFLPFLYPWSNLVAYLALEDEIGQLVVLMCSLVIVIFHLWALFSHPIILIPASILILAALTAFTIDKEKEATGVV